jgi:hypothetical protein
VSAEHFEGISVLDTGNFDMRLPFKTLLLSFASLWATAAFAELPARIDIPFSFTAKGKPFHAGNYSVELELQQGFIKLVNVADVADCIVLVAGPADRTKYSAVVKFYMMGNTHTLHSIQIGGRISRNLSDPDERQASFPVSIATR